MKIYLIWFYAVVMVGVNYVLRIFSEVLPSLIGVGILYYGFTMCMMFIGIRTCFKDKTE